MKAKGTLTHDFSPSLTLFLLSDLGRSLNIARLAMGCPQPPEC